MQRTAQIAGLYGIPSCEASEATAAIQRLPLDQVRSFAQTCFQLLLDLAKPAPIVCPSTPANGSNSMTSPPAAAQRRDEMATSLISSAPSVMDGVVQTDHLVKKLDQEGNKVINRYTVIDNLGQGAFGKVKLAVDEANCPVAIKIVRKKVLKQQADGERAIAREIAVMKKLKHRNVLPLYEVIDDPESEKLYMVMKFVDQGPISKARPDGTFDAIPSERLKELTEELVSGLSYLHKRGVAHRDIKPDNILVDSAGTPYFVDFGVSAIIDTDNPKVSTVEGTAMFMPPELFDDTTLKVDAFAADVWSLGATLYALLYGRAPFMGSNYREISLSVRNAPLTFPDASRGGVDADPGWEDLLRGMLCKDPAKRMSLKAVKKHQVLQQVDLVTDFDLEAATSRVVRFMQSEEPVHLSTPALLDLLPSGDFGLKSITTFEPVGKSESGSGLAAMTPGLLHAAPMHSFYSKDSFIGRSGLAAGGSSFLTQFGALGVPICARRRLATTEAIVPRLSFNYVQQEVPKSPDESNQTMEFRPATPADEQKRETGTEAECPRLLVSSVQQRQVIPNQQQTESISPSSHSPAEAVDVALGAHHLMLPARFVGNDDHCDDDEDGSSTSELSSRTTQAWRSTGSLFSGSGVEQQVLAPSPPKDRSSTKHPHRLLGLATSASPLDDKSDEGKLVCSKPDQIDGSICVRVEIEQ